jgi:putative endonuclease
MRKLDLMPKQWCVYILRCEDGTLYTGITNDIERRVTEHNSDNGGAKYTRPRKPVERVYMEPVESRSAAAKREYQIKRMPLVEKRRLVTGPNPDHLRRKKCIKL